MSMVISFTRVTPDALETAMEDPEWADEHISELDRPDEPSGYVDKAWDGIQFLLNAANVPIDLRMDGEPIDEEGYLIAWSPSVVAAAAGHLRATPFEQLAPHFDAARMTAADVYPSANWEQDDALGYLREYYGELVRFFDAAAASRSAAIMSFSY